MAARKKLAAPGEPQPAPRKRAAPPAPLPRKHGPPAPQRPRQVSLSADWSPAISRMWLEPIEHADDELLSGSPEALDQDSHQ